MAGAVDQAAFSELDAGFAGQLIRPPDAGYDEHRKVWNGSIDRRPALIARCTGVADVSAAVQVRATHRPARRRPRRRAQLPRPVGLRRRDRRSTSAPMKGIRVDPEARTARVQAGVLLGELDRETQAFGLAVPGGIVTHTGVAGLTLGGGIGWLMRKYGLTIDQLLSVDLITADGELVQASETENADLFWGVRGGGGNFGIVTEFEFRLNPVGPTVLGRADLLADRGRRRRCCASTATGSPRRRTS